MSANSPRACTEAFTAALVRRDMETALTLLSDDVVFFYSNGSTIVGKDAFSTLMLASWKTLQDYTYTTADHVWVAQSQAVASVVYSFSWTGKANGQAVSGAGRATRVLTSDAAGWRITHEHLSAGEWKP